MQKLFKKLLSLPFLAGFLIGLQGFLLIFDELSVHNYSRYELIVPGSRYGSIVVGSVLLYTALELRRGKRSAWWVASMLTVLSVFLHLINDHHILSLILSLMTLSTLLIAYKHFRVVSEVETLRSGFVRSIKLSALFSLVASLGFLVLQKRHFGTDFGILDSIKYATYQLYIGASELTPLTRQGKIFLDLVDITGWANYVLICAVLFKPATDKFILAPHVHSQVLEILKRFSKSSEDYFKYWPADKSYFFNTTHTGFVAYKKVGSICISPADPINTSESHRIKLLQSFTKFAKEQGWTPAFAHMPEASRRMYDKVGYKTIKVGASAVVPISTFLSETAKNKNFRNIINRFEKAEYSYELIEPGQASKALLQALKRVSDSWLSLPSRIERGFFLGYFDEQYLNESTLFLLKDGAGQIVAFTNMQPNFTTKRASIDLMRHIEDALPNTMDYLFYALIKELEKMNYSELDLGLAPLAQLENPEKIEEKGLRLLYTYANRWFAFQGLEKFKQKFEPNWEASYVAYYGSKAELPLIVYAIDKVMER